MSVVLHVGLPKTGTTYLQRLLAEQREPLRAAGVSYPLVRPGLMFHGALDVRGSAAKFGVDPGRVTGSWQRLCDEARDFEGTTVISQEILGGASRAEVERALAPLAGLDVHVVVTARDLGRLATAHWQEEVKLGATMSFADFERDQLRADSGRDEGPDAGGARPHFWHAQDFVDALDRWGRGLPGAQRHLVVAPAPGAEPGELWRRFAAAIGVDPGVIEVPDVAANPSLGAAEVALLRAVNLRLAGRIPPGAYHRVVKAGWAEQDLPGSVSTAPLRAPAELGRVFGPVTDGWLAELAAAGVSVHGDAADLAPVLAPAGAPPPDAPPPGDAEVDAVVERLLVAAAARGGPSGPSGRSGLWWARVRRVWSRLRARSRARRDPQPPS